MIQAEMTLFITLKKSIDFVRVFCLLKHFLLIFTLNLFCQATKINISLCNDIDRKISFVFAEF